jgi:hypothetical protein
MASVSRRWASGEASHLARFSSTQVLLIRKLYTNGNVTQSALAERFGMSRSKQCCQHTMSIVISRTPTPKPTPPATFMA